MSLDSGFSKIFRSKFFAILAFIALSAVFVYASGGPYNPGDTLDPGCNPGDVDCIVLSGSSSGVAIGDTVTNSTKGSLLFIDSSTGLLAENNDQFFWNNNERRLGIGESASNADATLAIRSSLSMPVNAYIPEDDKYVGGQFDLNDATFDYSSYSCVGDEEYRVSISAVGANDEFMWSDDAGNNWNGPVTISAVNTPFPLSCDVTVSFDSKTGHTLSTPVVGDVYWQLGSFTYVATGTYSDPLSIQTSSGVNIFSILDDGQFTINNIDYFFPNLQGTTGQVLKNDGSGNLSWSNDVSGWGLAGNPGTTAGTNFIGTTDTQDLVFKVNNAEVARFVKDIGPNLNQISFGFGAGTSATNASNSNFLGTNAGHGATNASNSNFLGTNAGHSATGATYSNFLGVGAGQGATDATYSNFLGTNAGTSATNASNSNFLGTNAGTSATNASNSNFLGTNAGHSATGATYSNFLGANAGTSATNAPNSNFLGSSAGYGATNASGSNFIGSSAGHGATDATYSNFLGTNAGTSATNASGSNFIGSSAGHGATNASGSVFIGASAGTSAVNAKSSIFIGVNAGLSDTVDNSVSGTSILIGDNTSTGGFSNSIAIGAGATNTASNQFLIDDSYTQFNMRGINWVMPSSQGGAGEVLTNDGSGNLSWETPTSSGTIGLSTGTSGTDVNVSGSPASLGGTLTLNIPDASAAARGLITTGTQTIAGTKTFSSAPLITGFNQGGIVYSDLSGLLASTAAGTSGQVLTSNGTSAPTWQALSAWSTTGNSGTTAGTNFIGTTDAQDLVFKSNNIEVGRLVKNSGANADMLSFGRGAGSGATNATASVFLGYDAGSAATGAFYSNFSGFFAGKNATNAYHSNFFGNQAGSGATGASLSNFFGYSSGLGATNATFSTLIGVNVGKTFTGNNIGANNIIIGKNISLPNGTTNALNIGGVLFGSGTESSFTANPVITPVSGGRIGIGVVSPLDTLQVAGDIRTGTTGSNGCIKDFAGTGIVGTCSSDEDLKQDIQDLPELSDKFSKVRFVTYKWNGTAKELYSNNADVTNTGTLAQSVELQFPELVSRDDKGYRVVNYSGLLMYGMEAIKEVVSLAESFREKLISWFADAANGIGDLFVKRVRTETLCVGSVGNETCITKEQLDNLLGGQSVSAGGNSGGGSGGTGTPIGGNDTITPDPEPTPDPAPDPIVDENPDPSPSPDPAPAADPTPDPEPTPDPAPDPIVDQNPDPLPSPDPALESTP